MDLTASDTARLTGISVRSINTLFLKLRQRLAAECEQLTPFDGVVELDESYFGAKRIRGKRGRGAGGKTIVFGVLKRGDKVYGNRTRCLQSHATKGYTRPYLH